MGLDDTVNLERIATALTRLAQAFDQYNILYQRQLELEHPQEKPKRASEIISSKTERENQLSDRASDEWMWETEAALPQEPSRFQKRFDDSPDKRVETPRRRRAVAVPEVH